MEAIKNLKILERRLKKIDHGVSADTIFTAKAIFFIAYQQEEIILLLRKLTRTRSHLRAKRWWEFWK